MTQQLFFTLKVDSKAPWRLVGNFVSSEADLQKLVKEEILSKCPDKKHMKSSLGESCYIILRFTGMLPVFNHFAVCSGCQNQNIIMSEDVCVRGLYNMVVFVYTDKWRYLP